MVVTMDLGSDMKAPEEQCLRNGYRLWTGHLFTSGSEIEGETAIFPESFVFFRMETSSLLMVVPGI